VAEDVEVFDVGVTAGAAKTELEASAMMASRLNVNFMLMSEEWVANEVAAMRWCVMSCRYGKKMLRGGWGSRLYTKTKDGEGYIVLD